MMKIAIWGTQNEALELLEIIQKNKLGVVCIFIENNKDISRINNIKVVTYEDFIQSMLYQGIDMMVIASKSPYSMNTIYKEIKCKGKELKNIDIAYLRHGVLQYKNNTNSLKELIIELNANELVIPYLEMQIADTCNLKCRGCTHFSNICSEPNYIDEESFRRSLERIAEIGHVVFFRILGGEPLLNPNLYRLVQIARSIFFNTDISIVTNGLLIMKQRENLFESMRENEVGFDISRYIPTGKIEKQLKEFLNHKGVIYKIADTSIEVFDKNLSYNRKSNAINASKTCRCKCLILKNDKLYKCAFDAYINVYLDYFGYPLRKEEGLEIFNQAINWKQMLEDLNLNPVKLCVHCSEYLEELKWENGGEPCESDWNVLRN